MNKKFSFLFRWLVLFLLVSFPIGAADTRQVISDSNPGASIMVGSYSIEWLPKISAEGIQLTIAGPENFYWTQTFPKGTRPRFAIADIQGQCLDGQYYYDMTVQPQAQRQARQEGDFSVSAVYPPAVTQSGSFRIHGGAFLSLTLTETQSKVMDVVHADDVIITGSQCVGFDCLTDGTENFGFDTIKMKENNLRVFFDDTSSTAGFPANDWRIITNDSSSGGANYFSIEDSTGAKTPFKIIAGARTSSIFVSSTGRVGFGTSTPVLNLHILHGDTPSMRLDQDTSSGWTAQVWDIAGNESNFFVRDTTGGSKLPFRIQPGTPTNTITMKSDGKVGIGTWSPEYKVEVETTGENAAVVVQRTDGVTNYINATDTYGNFGTVTNHATRIIANGAWRARFNTDNSLTMANNATLTAGGTWTNASSIAFKDNVQGLNAGAAVQALAQLRPVTFAYKVDHSEKHVGFIAEEVPELVAMNDRKSLSPMDIVAVLTKVVQEQQKTIEELSMRLEKLEKKDQ